jgi:arabinogalactan endo-1,4-beta-galactosidase
MVKLTIARSDDYDNVYFFKGHDLSSLKLLEDGGSIYKDTSRHDDTRPAEDILGDGGMNSIRLRIWVSPSDDIYGPPYTPDLVKRLYAKGYKIYLDFHFAEVEERNKMPF